MKRYIRLKTTEGHRYLVRMTEEEIAARRVYNAVLVILPFVTSVAMFWLWIKVG